MICPDLIQDLEDLPSEELRELIARAAGIHAYRDHDGGTAIVAVLSRIAQALVTMPTGEFH